MEKKVELEGKFEKIFMEGYPCMTRVFGYVFDKIGKRWKYDENLYKDLLEKEFGNNGKY